MPFQTLLVYLPDVLNGEDGPVVRIFRVFVAILLVCVDLQQHFRKFFLRVVDVPQKFVIEVQDTGAVSVRRPPVVPKSVYTDFITGK